MSLTLLAPPSEPISASPSLTREQKRHIRETFTIIEPASDLVARLFYMKSVDLDPSLGVLFKSPNRVQRRKFMAAMKVAVLSLDVQHDPRFTANGVAATTGRDSAGATDIAVLVPGTYVLGHDEHGHPEAPHPRCERRTRTEQVELLALQQVDDVEQHHVQRRAPTQSVEKLDPADGHVRSRAPARD